MRFFQSVFRQLAYLFAVLIVLFALITVVVREFTPLLNQYRVDFEHYASNVLQVPVSIKQVRVSWRQYQPVIDLDQVTFHNKDTHLPVMTVQRVTVFFSIPYSLWSRQVVTNGILIDGAAVSIKQTTEGDYKVYELSSLGIDQLPGTQETAFKDVVAWLSQIPKLILRNIELRVTRLNDVEREITLQDLRFENAGMTHHVDGGAILHQALPMEVSIASEWRGQELDLAHIDGKVYLYVSGLNLPQWLNDKSWQGWMVKEGVASARIWLDWSQGVVKQVQSQLQFYGLNFKSTQTNEGRRINRMSGNIGLRRDGQELVIAGDDILLNLPGHLWPVTSFYLSLNNQGDQQFHPKQLKLSYFDLQDVQSFVAPLFKQIPDTTLQLLKRLQCQGGIQNLSIQFAEDWQDWQHLSASGRLQRVSTKQTQNYPGIKNITGDFQWHGASGSLRLDSERTVFTAPTVFQNDLLLDQVMGLIEFNREDQQGWQVKIANLQLLNHDLAMTAKGLLTLRANETPIADITANFTVQQAAHVSDYLPLAIFEKDLTLWLRQAFLAGEVQAGRAVLRGPLSAFPFDHGEGEFAINGRVNHVDFRFAPDWPTLDKIDGTIDFVGRKLEVNLEHAETLGVKTSKARGVINSIGGKDPAILQVVSEPIGLDLTAGMNYLFKSPLNATLGGMLKYLSLQGQAQLSLGLTIPLEHPEQTVVSGDLVFNDSSLSLSSYDLFLNQVTGALHFTEDSVQANHIQSILFNKPFQFDIATRRQAHDHSVIQVFFDQTLDVTDIERWLKYSFNSYVDGSTRVAGIIDLVKDQPAKIALKSKLKGLAIHTQSLLDKTSNVEKNISAELVITESEPVKIRVNYDNEFNAALLMTRNKNDFAVTAANLWFGEGVPSWPTQPGLFLSGRIATLNTDKIKSYLQQSSRSLKPGLPLMGLDLTINSVQLGGLALTNLIIKAAPENDNWVVVIDSQEVAGKMTVPKQWSRRGLLDAQFSRVKLVTPATKSNTPMDWDVKSLPTISIKIADLNIDNMSLGKLDFRALPQRNGLTIKSLNLSAPYLSLQTTGEWVQSGRQTKTNIKGEAKSPRVTRMLKSLAFSANNFEAGEGNAKFSLGWVGAPFEISLSKLQGQAALTLGEGRIVDVGKEGGAKMDLARMLSLFSLQTIPRRLLFDFSDVFQKGYSFDSMRGDLAFDNGNLSTRNLRFEGPVARLGIQGRIGLTNKDYDLILDVTSHVTSTIPVAAALLTGNPLIGVGAFVANALVGSRLSKVTGYEYTIKGSWDNPVWQAVKSK